MIQAIVDSSEPQQRYIGFRRVEISRRGIHPQAVAIACPRYLFPGADRHRMPKQPAEPSHVELDFLELTSTVGSCSFCQRCHCGERARHGEAGFGRKRDQRGTLVGAEWIGLIAPIEKMGIRPNRVIAVLCSVVVCKEPFRFFVDAATFEVGQCTEQKARHSAIRSNLLAHLQPKRSGLLLPSSWEAKDEVLGELSATLT